MKKFLLTLIALSTLASSLFADIFDNRYFEIRTYADADVSTNTFKPTSFLVKDCVIDLSAIADSVPKSGFNTSLGAKTGVAMSIDIPGGLILGVDTGMDLYSSLNLSKSLFDFFGYGYDFTENETLNINCNNSYIDSFAYVGADIGWNANDLTLVFTPTVFTTVAHWSLEKAQVNVYNKDDGTFGYDMQALVAMYGAFTMDSIQNFNMLSLGNALKKGIGLDIAATATYDLFDSLSLGANIRIPIRPSYANDKISYEYTSQTETNVQDLIDGNNPNLEFTSNGPIIEENTEFYINRPMLIGVNATYMPFGNFLQLNGGIGLGYKHPFSAKVEEQGVYVDYELGALLSLGNIINLKLSSVRESEIYKHKAELGLNVRIAELDLGIAAESVSFLSSLCGEGFGAYFAVCIGF